VVSGFTELLDTGRLGAEGATLLYATVAAVARFDRYPPPEGHQAWSSDAVTEVAHEFLVGPHANERLVHLATLALDDASFARLLETSVRNFFRSRARATTRGKLYRRVRSLLEGDDRFVPVEGSDGRLWTLSEGSSDPWVGRIDALLAVAGSVPVPLSGSDRARRDALGEICAQVLAAAEGAVSLDDLAGVASWRLGLIAPPISVDIDSMEPEAAVDVATESVAALDAQAVFEVLTDRERLLLLVLDEPVRQVAEFVGLGKSSAALAVTRLRDNLRALIPDEADLLEVLGPLTRLAATWAGERTESSSTAY
jgi:hypothetical protein